MKKNILVIFTGGTICTTIKNGVMSTTTKATAALIDLFKKSSSLYKDRVYLEEGKRFNILSENMTVSKWNKIIEYFQETLPTLSEYSGIIVAHGTDTLAYSTALFSQLLKDITIPVFFVSSNHPILLEDDTPNPVANGTENFRAAIECICRNIKPGVYATYKNPDDGLMYLHKGEHLTQCDIYDENFYSRDALDITDPNLCVFETVNEYESFKVDHLPIMKMKNKHLEDCILKVVPYVGLNYDMFNPQNAKAVLHGTYHSGTACVVKTAENSEYISESNSILYFFDKCAAHSIPFYYSPSKIGEKDTVYASVPFIEKHTSPNGQRVQIHYGQTDELMYVKLLIGYSLNFTQEQIDKFLIQA